MNKFEPLFDLVRSHIAEQRYPGCQIAIAAGGQLLVNRSFGLSRTGVGHAADTQALAADNQHLWLLYSNTKVLMACTLWKLYEQGRLQFTDSVADHLPDFAAKGKQDITLLQVITHQGGFPDADVPASVWQDHARILQTVCEFDLQWIPGSRVYYHGLSAHWVLADLANAEGSVSAGGVKASGHLRITAPAGFGRRHVAPLVPRFRELHPEVTLSLNLSDRVVDLAGEAVDCAVRVGDMPDSSLISVRLADNRRLCVATPAYLQRHGRPLNPQDLNRFDCLTLSSDASQTRGWAFSVPKGEGRELVYLKAAGPLDCSDGQVLHDWCLRGLGIAWRSTWEVESEVAAGTLEAVLEAYAAPPNGIYAVFAHAKHLPLRVRLWIDFLKHHYGQAGYWQAS